MEVERLLVMAPAIGVMERILERCVAYARQRKVGSVAIAKHQAIARGCYADIELGLEASRLLLSVPPGRARRDHRDAGIHTAKLAVSEAYVERPRRRPDLRGLRDHRRVQTGAGVARRALRHTVPWGRPRSSETSSPGSGAGMIVDDADGKRRWSRPGHAGCAACGGDCAPFCSSCRRPRRAPTKPATCLSAGVPRPRLGRFEIPLADFNAALRLTGTTGDHGEHPRPADRVPAGLVRQHVTVSDRRGPLSIRFTSHSFLKARSGCRAAVVRPRGSRRRPRCPDVRLLDPVDQVRATAACCYMSATGQPAPLPTRTASRSSSARARASSSSST